MTGAREPVDTEPAQEIVVDVVRELVQMSAFLWSQLQTLQAAHPRDEAAITTVCGRLEAFIDGLRVAGVKAWPLAVETFEDYPDSGGLFVLTFLAMQAGDTRRLDHCAALARGHPELRQGFVGALLLFPAETTAPLVRRWLNAPGGALRASMIDMLAHHRVDPGEALPRMLADPSPLVRAAACALAGTLHRADTTQRVADLAAKDEDTDVGLQAALCLNALGHRDPAARRLERLSTMAGPDALVALRALSQLLQGSEYRAFLSRLHRDPTSRITAIRGLGMTKDRSLGAWLIEQMTDPEAVEAAGESFLELFPEAADVGGLYSFEAEDLDPALHAKAQDAAQPLIVAAKVAQWLDAAQAEADPALA